MKRLLAPTQFAGLGLLCLLTAGAACAGETAIGFDPLTVRAGEEMRITLFNPHTEPLVLRVFSYNAVESTYDEGPSFTLPPGKMRFFDFKVNKDFVGLGGVIEQTPEVTTNSSAAAAGAPSSKQPVKPAIMLTDLLVSSVKSRGSLQHRGTSGQTQTMGYSFGANQTGGGWFKTIQSQAKRVTASEWVESAQY